MNKKKGWLIACGVIVLLVCICCGYFFFFKEEWHRIIKVNEYVGDVVLKRETLGELTLHKNMRLENKDEMSSGKESYIRLSLDADKFVYVEEHSRFQIEADGEEENAKTRIILKEGAIVSEIQKPLNAYSSYEVETPNSSMSVRGTVFRVSVSYDENGESYTQLHVFDGKVANRLIDPNGMVSEKEIVVPAGKMLTAHGDEEKSEYLFADVDTKEVVSDIVLDNLPLQTLESLETIIENGKNEEMVFTMEEVEEVIVNKEQKENSKIESNKEKEEPSQESTNENIRLEKEKEVVGNTPAQPPLETITYRILFESRGGSSIEAMEFIQNEKMNLPIPSRAGYTFTGWYQDDTLTNKVQENSLAQKDMHLYAGWKAKNDTPYSVEVYLEDEDGNYILDIKETYFGTTDTHVEVIPKEKMGYEINDTRTVVSTIVKGDGSGTIAHYYERKPDMVKVTFVYPKQIGLEEIEVMVQKGSLLSSLPKEPSVPGYRFIGWYHEGLPFDFSQTKVQEDIVVEAKIEAIEVDYKVIARFNDGSEDSIETYRAKADSDVVLDVEDYRYKYDKDETYYILDEANSTLEGKIKADGTTTFIIQYEKAYQVVFVSRDDSVLSERKVKANATLALQEQIPPTVIGYVFRGWQVNADKIWGETDIVPIEENTRFKAVYEALEVPYTIMYTTYWPNTLDKQEMRLPALSALADSVLDFVLRDWIPNDGFEYDEAKNAPLQAEMDAGKVTVAPDGSTIINIYINRKKCDISYYDNITGNSIKLFSADYGTELSSYLANKEQSGELTLQEGNKWQYKQEGDSDYHDVLSNTFLKNKITIRQIPK